MFPDAAFGDEFLFVYKSVVSPADLFAKLDAALRDEALSPAVSTIATMWIDRWLIHFASDVTDDEETQRRIERLVARLAPQCGTAQVCCIAFISVRLH